MNTKILNGWLEEYKKIDLDIAILNKQKNILKDKIKNNMLENNADSYSFNEYKASVYDVSRVMYLKEKLQEYVEPEVLKRCSKTIKMTNIRISYEK